MFLVHMSSFVIDGMMSLPYTKTSIAFNALQLHASMVMDQLMGNDGLGIMHKNMGWTKKRQSMSDSVLFVMK